MTNKDIIKSFEIICSEGVSGLEKEAVKSALKNVLDEIQAPDCMTVAEKNEKHRVLNNYIMQHITQKTSGFGRQIDAIGLLRQARQEGMIDRKDYFVLLVDNDMFNNLVEYESEKNEYSSGICYTYDDSLKGAIISTIRYKNLKNYEELLRTAMFHECGHIFGAAENRTGIRTDGTLYSGHCSSKDVMRQAKEIPIDVELITEERLESGIIYCETCICEMKEHLKKAL